MRLIDIALIVAAFTLGIIVDRHLPDRPDDTIPLDLAQWQCTQAATVYELERGDLVPKGRCTNYRMIVQEGGI